jgi:hypothetical protein
MKKLVINYADSNVPTFITRVVEVDEPGFWDEETTYQEKQDWIESEVQAQKQVGANGAQQVLVFHFWKEV